MRYLLLTLALIMTASSLDAAEARQGAAAYRDVQVSRTIRPLAHVQEVVDAFGKLPKQIDNHHRLRERHQRQPGE